MSLRVKGFIGSLFRAMEIVRSFPVRLAEWTPWASARRRSGRRAASLLSGGPLLDTGARLVSESVKNRYQNKHSELALEFTRAGFDPPSRAR